MPRVTARRVPKESGLAGVCQTPRGFEISITGHGEVASVFALIKGFQEYYGWTYNIFKTPEYNLPEIRAWEEPGVVPKGKVRFFKFTEEGRNTAKKTCIERIKGYLNKGA